ncbi:MAG: transglycosylase domain-containing protein [Holophagaceae bacterium]|nr:transglycosylase domain-containing protein [Holophagaceae bacterium]
MIARKLEKASKKRQIFEAYANEVYFGGGRYGIGSGGPVLFGKRAPSSTWRSAPTLAASSRIPAGTTLQSRSWVRAAVKARRNHVLRRVWRRPT